MPTSMFPEVEKYTESTMVKKCGNFLLLRCKTKVIPHLIFTCVLLIPELQKDLTN